MTRTRIAVLLLGLVIPLLLYAGDINQDLIEAAKKGDTAAVQALLAKGADANAKDKYGRTALILAAAYGSHSGTVRALLAAGAEVNAKNKFGETALSLATREGHKVIIELLKKAGAKK